jgi:uncharacterized protein
MTPQERQLITELLARLKKAPAQAKDADADQLIREGVMDDPEAPYLLVQTVLIQDMALSQARNRVAELEDQLSKSKTAPSAQRSQRAASFLGGALSPSSVSAAGPLGRASQPVAPASQPAAPLPATAPGWNQSAASPASFAGAAAPALMSSASSGFLRTAAATALGITGGQLLFQGIESMFGEHAGSVPAGPSIPPALSETVVNNYYGDRASSAASTDVTDAEASSGAPVTQDMSDDPTVADDDWDRDGSDQDFEVTDTVSDDSLEGDDTELT